MPLSFLLILFVITVVLHELYHIRKANNFNNINSKHNNHVEESNVPSTRIKLPQSIDSNNNNINDNQAYDAVYNTKNELADVTTQALPTTLEKSPLNTTIDVENTTKCENQYEEEKGNSVASTPSPSSTSSSLSVTPKIVIAYATNTKNAFIYAHKLFSILTNALSENASQAAYQNNIIDQTDSKGNDNSTSCNLNSTAHIVQPRIEVLEIGQDDNSVTDNDSDDNECYCNKSNTQKICACMSDTNNNSKTRRSNSNNNNGSYFTFESLTEDKSAVLIIFIVSTYTDGAAPPRSQGFELLLKDAYEDHRVPRDLLCSKRIAIFGLGDVAYGAVHFNAFGKHIVSWCKGLGAPSCVVPPIYASEAKATLLFQMFTASLQQWLQKVIFTDECALYVQKRSCKNGKVYKNGKTKPKKSVNDNKNKTKRTGVTLDKTTTAFTPENVEEEEESSSELLLLETQKHKSNHENENATSENTKHKTSSDNLDSNTDEEDDSDNDNNSSEDDNNSSSEMEGVEDVEDIIWDGQIDQEERSRFVHPELLPELLYTRLRENLNKQGYRLIGSHSAVKLCRWTKSMLRGHGGCYKHTFYNINSAQCMEMTPSLACANKCIFCWRHHTNPVSRTFRWRQDPPELLLAKGMEEHYKMIKQMRGVPGVTPERLQEANNIRHCALSLVGEPIMYPQINRFCELLHRHHISSFMVTNAQFPEQLQILQPVVQLYLSIDAATPEELKRIDRPLFEDYWERCVACVRVLRNKPERTVFRLTLVNAYNNSNIDAYADLVQMGWPDFIEVKGVTYCGTGNEKGSAQATPAITMKTNVPRHDEVITFCEALCSAMAQRNPLYTSATMNDNDNDNDNKNTNSKIMDVEAVWIAPERRNRPYHIACEHEHSCCVLIALDKFYYNHRWHTWIDYDKFYSLIEQDSQRLNSLDYAMVTPSWAVYQSPEQGFDPAQTRLIRKKARPTAASVLTTSEKTR